MIPVGRLPFAALELIMLALFVAALRYAWRSGGWVRLLELVSAVPYAMLLEQGDITIFGSYVYSQGFFVTIGAVPIAIALAWALIISSCMYLSDSVRVPVRLAPFTDALLAIILDLSFDAIAIRQGLWHWNLRLDDGYFGVPAGNFYAWLFVAFGFSAWTRLVRRLPGRKTAWLQLLVGLPAYATLLLALVPYIALKVLFFPAPGAGFPLFLATLAVFTVAGGRSLLARRGRLVRPWRMPLLPRLAMHVYFVGAGLVLGIFWQSPFLLVGAAAMGALDLWLQSQSHPASTREQMAA